MGFLKNLGKKIRKVIQDGAGQSTIVVIGILAVTTIIIGGSVYAVNNQITGGVVEEPLTFQVELWDFGGNPGSTNYSEGEKPPSDSPPLFSFNPDFGEIPNDPDCQGDSCELEEEQPVFGSPDRDPEQLPEFERDNNQIENNNGEIKGPPIPKWLEILLFLLDMLAFVLDMLVKISELFPWLARILGIVKIIAAIYTLLNTENSEEKALALIDLMSGILIVSVSLGVGTTSTGALSTLGVALLGMSGVMSAYTFKMKIELGYL